MKCELCKLELEAYREGNLPGGIMKQVEEHLKNCKDCNEINNLEIISNRVIDQEKETQSNPFLAIRVMAEIELLESNHYVPAYKKILKPAIIMVSLTAAILLGIIAGSIYQPIVSSDEIPVEMVYMDDASLESVELLANN
jgi:predicted anti-sigma-YlaC factor YlaD